MIFPFTFPPQHFQTDSINCQHSLHMRFNNPTQKYQNKPFLRIYHCDKLPCKCLSELVAQLLCSTAGWEEEPYWKFIRDFFFCLLHVSNRSRQVPSISSPPLPSPLFMSPTWQISIPPPQVPFLLFTHAHTFICHRSGEGIQDTQCSDYAPTTPPPCFHTCRPILKQNKDVLSC